MHLASAHEGPERTYEKHGEEKKELTVLKARLYDSPQGLPERGSSPSRARLVPRAQQTGTAEELYGSIEEGIKKRNEMYEKSKGVPRSPSSLQSHESESNPNKREKLHAVPVEQLNLEVMNPKQTDFGVDLVAVHAIPDITWTEHSTRINWLSEDTMLPSATPQARILRFGYDSLWMGKTAIRTSLSTIAYKLLLTLCQSRMEHFKRPLLFVGHCFGGLVIQRALNLAKMQDQAYPNIFDSTVGVIFLGTPHRGTQSFKQDSALFAAIAASSELYRDNNIEPGVLKAMESENGSLLDVTDDFTTLCAETAEKGPKITCFFEQRSSKLGKIVGRHDIDEFIVDQKSATLDGHRKYGLELDHFSLNKFDGPKNPNYLQVRGEIIRFYSLAMERVSSPSNAGPVRRRSEGQLPICISSRLPQTATHDDEDIRLKAIRLEAFREVEYEQEKKRRIQFEEAERVKRLEDKSVAEQRYFERLRKNMTKYGVENPEEILERFPLPNDKDLSSEQEILEKVEWHKNLIKGELSAASVGLDGGQIDEILNDTGDTMIIDQVQTTFTKMAKKWISVRTLDRYHIPWQDDKDDKSVLIVKRWVPDYERNFLWDHSLAVRDQRGRRPSRGDDERAEQPSPIDKQNLLSGIRLFDNQKSHGHQKLNSTSKEGAIHHGKNAANDMYRKRPHSQEHDFFEPDVDEIHRGKKHRRSHSRGDAVNRAFQGSSSAPIHSTMLPTIQHTASNDSMQSAPAYDEVERRRKKSRTLSASWERKPIARQSEEYSSGHKFRRGSLESTDRASPYTAPPAWVN
ncbi:hypothetical protein HBI44_148440 [Parastagonospora nodorum]|nr:hypothetical protein HBH42_093330 [Parastagonospora nodorum]KAH5426716.1 hypothetical protein HBI47_118120 [Parastagonospora nodorum]KAH5693407.1 hypothetical protein HBI44_148440 [Parastagonospora nodorum]